MPRTPAPIQAPVTWVRNRRRDASGDSCETGSGNFAGDLAAGNFAGDLGKSAGDLGDSFGDDADTLVGGKPAGDLGDSFGDADKFAGVLGSVTPGG